MNSEMEMIEEFIKNNPQIVEEDPQLEHLPKGLLVKIASARFQGPIPHPSLMKGYEEALPGAADRIIKMAEEQASHRRKLEEQYMKTQSRDSLFGIISALVIALAIVGCGTLIIIKVPSTAGVVSGSLLNLLGIGTVVGTFLRGTGHKSKDDE